MIDGNRYSLKDISVSGFAMLNETKVVFDPEKVYQCHLTVRNEPRLNIKIKMKRSFGDIVGWEVIEKDIFEKFINSNLKL